MGRASPWFTGTERHRRFSEADKLRLVAAAERREDGTVDASVAPLELPEGDLLASLRGTANALIVHTDLLGDIAITQLGGGLTMTAYALLSDVVAIRRRA